MFSRFSLEFYLKRALLSIVLSAWAVGLGVFSAPMAGAVASSVLPQNSGEYFECTSDDTMFQAFMQERSVMESVADYSGEGDTDTQAMMEDFLGCAIKLGQVKFWMVPYFVNYVLEFLITVAGVLVVLMIIIGGYYYIAGAVTDDKEKGKTIITYAIGGYVLILTSWFIVNTLLLAVSS